MLTRRNLIKLIAASSASSLVLPPLPGATGRRAGPSLNYGLFFDEADLDRIRRTYFEDPDFAAFRESLESFDMEGEVAWIRKDLRFNDQLFNIARLGRTVESMAFLYLMTGRDDAAELARQSVEAIMQFERWDFFLDGDIPIAVQRASSSTVAVSLASDFLGEALPEADRRRWFRMMGQKGCRAAYRTLYGIRFPQEVIGWRFDPESTFFEHRPGNRTDMNRRPEITENTNLRAVPASALVLGTLTYQLEFGEDADTRKWMEMGVHGLEVFRGFFKEDGSYDEEVNYANYTAGHIQQAVLAMQRHTHIDMMDIINWNAYVDFLLHMSMPTHQDPYGLVNFGDSGGNPDNPNSVKRTALPLWIAAYEKNPKAQGFAKTMAGTHDLWSVLWHDPAVKPAPPESGPVLWVSDLDRVVARTGYGVDDLVVALRSGPPANHEHADRNAILVKCYGEELVTDPLRPPYSYADPSWRMRLTEGHSAVLVDGQGHEHHNGVEGTNASQSFARVTRSHSDDSHALWVSDATQPYRLVDLNIKSVVRSLVVFFAEPAVVVIDRFEKWKTPSTLQARFFGYNLDGKIEQDVTDDGFVVRRPHATLHAAVFSTTGHNIMKRKLDVAEDRAEAHPFIDVATAPAMSGMIATVLLPTRPDSAPGTVSFAKTRDGFSLAVAGRSIQVDAAGAFQVS